MSNEQSFEVRDLRNGDWYWIHKAVIQEYTKSIGAIGIAVYNLLASMTNSDQDCYPSQSYIARSLGYSRSYINETIKLLEKHNLIRVEKKGRYHRIYHLLKVRRQLGRTQVSPIPNSGVVYTDTNKNKRTRNINNIDNKNIMNRNSITGFRPSSREELLALDLANTLGDHKGLPLYLSYAKRFPESLLRKKLGEVKEIPQEKIRKSRAALFNHLIQKHAKRAAENNRD